MTARADWRSRSTTTRGTKCRKHQAFPHRSGSISITSTRSCDSARSTAAVRPTTSFACASATSILAKWPQNLIYGVHFRIYYDAPRSRIQPGSLTSPRRAKRSAVKAELAVSAPVPSRIRQVDFLACHEDVNLEGDGQYTQWHYHYVAAAERTDRFRHRGALAVDLGHLLGARPAKALSLGRANYGRNAA